MPRDFVQRKILWVPPLYFLFPEFRGSSEERPCLSGLFFQVRRGFVLLPSGSFSPLYRKRPHPLSSDLFFSTVFQALCPRCRIFRGADLPAPENYSGKQGRDRQNFHTENLCAGVRAHNNLPWGFWRFQGHLWANLRGLCLSLCEA